MNHDQDGRQFRLLTLHSVLWSLAMSLASGFVGAYLLRLGFSIAATIAMYAALLVLRFGFRAIMLPVVRRLGMQRSICLGAFIAAFQFLPLIRAEQPFYLAMWILIVSAGECIYWPIYHAANAMCGGADGRRGRQLAARQMASTVISVLGPVIGGILMSHLGPGAEFGVATVVCVASTAPLWWLGNIDLGCVPSVRRSLKAADMVGLAAFAADGWMCAGTGISWGLILFTTLGSSYDALGWASSAAAVAGAMAGVWCGIAIDRGSRHRLSHLVSLALLLGIVLRVASGWALWMAFAANAFGAAVGGLYYPVLMSVVYDRAKRSGSAYQFHLSTEAGWDAGATLGCLVCAAVAWSGAPVTLAVLPAALGVVVIQRCVLAESRAVRMVRDGLPLAA
jgi:MFS family permease